MQLEHHHQMKGFMMTEKKPWYLSKTVWSAAISVVATLGGMLGLPVGAVDQVLLTDAVLQSVAAVAGVFAIFGRVTATHALK
ncbi:MAG: hypothetical protein AAFX98_02110 [Pseudomonadota bacterium]